MQNELEVLVEGRKAYAKEPVELIAARHHRFATIAVANDY
jgi:hypothetical protein